MLLILLIMMTTACSTQSTGGNTDTPKSAGLNGTYIGEGQGNNGIVQIETTFVDGKITKVEVKSHSETPGICEVAIENVPKRIIESNSINVDAVSGATNTSNAIISAVKAAIENAGGRVDDYMAQAENEIEKEIINTEVLIVGAGGAGLSAAVSAKENGADVLVIEKNGSVGGATAVSGGGFMGGASKLQAELGVTGDTPEQIFKDLLAGGKDNDETMLWLLANNAGKMVDWLYYDLKLPVNQSVSASVEHTYPRGFSMEGGASAITSSLSDKFKELGGKIMLETKATELIYKDGKVVGVKASGVDKEYEIYADSVILATGGYGANKDLLPESVSKVLYYGPATSTGDGLLMAQKVGAATMYLDHVKIYPQGIEIAEGIGAVATGGSMTATKQEGAIYVNKSGERVVNENAPRKGYAGTMTLYKKDLKPLVSFPKIGAPGTMDYEGRIITLEFEDFYLTQVYTPNAGDGLNRLEDRQVWDIKYAEYLESLDKQKYVIATGDFNVAHKEIDLAHPESNRRSAGFTDEEREGFTNLLNRGFTDTFRYIHGDVPKVYTWWAQRVATSKINNS